jgi:hypothetical protein
MYLDRRFFHVAEECRRGGLTADRIVKDAHVQAGARTLLEGFSHGRDGDIIKKDVALHPTPLLSGLDGADQGGDHRQRLDEDR